MTAYIGEIAALLTAVLWSSSSFVFTAAIKRIGSIQLNISRMVLAALLLLLTFWIFDIPLILSQNQLILLSISGFIGLTLGDSFLYKAYQLIGPRVSMLLMSFNPAVAAIVAFFMIGETLSVFSIIGMFVTLSGISIVILEKPNGNDKFKITKFGVICGILAAIGQGVGLVFSKQAYLVGDMNVLVATFIRIAAAVAFLLPGAILFKKYKNPFKIFKNDRKSLWLVILGSIIGPYLGITLSFLAVIYTKVGIASTLMSTIPIIMLPMSKLIYKEQLSWKSIIGAFIAVAGVAMLFLV